MGREFSHYNLLSQRIMNPLDHASETGSGLFAGRIQNPAAPFFIAREALLPFDLLRVGFEDDPSHSIQKVTRAIPKKGRFFLEKASKFKVKKGTPVYIIDRRGPDLAAEIKALDIELNQLETVSIRPVKDRVQNLLTRKPGPVKINANDINLSRGKLTSRNHRHADTGVWISTRGYSAPAAGKNWLWLDPVVFPEEEKDCFDYIGKAVKKGAKNFVLNAVWQLSFFKNPGQLNLWAGPFCNITNSMTVNLLKSYGFSGAIVSPELDKNTFTSLPQKCDLPLGVVIYGNWPLGVSRVISPDLKTNQAFTSPMGETSWISKHNRNYLIFPNWVLDLNSKRSELEKAGYSLFVTIHETIPRSVKMKNRPGLWNWNLKLL
jgi:putative protease